MKYIVYIIVTGALVAVTTGLFNVFQWHGFVPNLLLLAIVSLALAFDTWDHLLIAVLGGIWLDTLYGLPIGSFAIPFVVIGTISSMVFQRWLFTQVTWRHFLLAITVATLLLEGWVWVYVNVLYLFKWSALAISGGQLIRNILFALLANIILAYPVYVVVELIAQATHKWKKHQLKL